MSTNFEKTRVVYKAVLEQLRALGEAFDTVKDKNSAKLAAVKVNKICDRLGELADEAEKLPKLNEDEDLVLKELLEPEIKRIFSGNMKKRTEQAMQNCEGEPDFMNATRRLQDVDRALEKLAKR